MTDYGWMRWPMGDYRLPLDPYAFDRVWINREGWESPEVVDPRILDPMMNVVGLMWKPAPALPKR